MLIERSPYELHDFFILYIYILLFLSFKGNLNLRNTLKTIVGAINFSLIRFQQEGIYDWEYLRRGAKNVKAGRQGERLLNAVFWT